MPTPAAHLPQMHAPVFLTDGGLETSLIFDEGIELPHFAAFVLLADDAGRAALGRYFDAYVDVALRDGVGIVLETPTWRASADWAPRLGYSVDEVAEANRASVAFLVAIRDRRQTPSTPIVISGCVGPRGDGYQPGEQMTADEARNYHALQVRAFAEAGADLVTAITMTNTDEAIGVVAAAQAAGLAVVISFTVETDGALPTGQALADAIAAVDAATDGYPAYYMVNCAHPTHFDHVLDPAAPWTARIKGIRANASRRSHAELDEAEELDAGDPGELAEQYRALRRTHPGIVVVGGCCGTNHEHVDAISRACAVPRQQAVALPNGVTLSVATQGPASGPAVVLVHGWPDSWRSYEPVLAALPTDVRAVAVSLRGFGLSDRPEGGYEPADFAGDVASLLDVLRIDDTLLVGHSMGSMVVQRLALDHPERVRGAVLIGGFASISGDLADGITGALELLTDPADDAFIREFQSSMLTRPLAGGFFDTIVAESSAAPLRVWRAAFAGVAATDLGGEISAIKAPVRLIWGDHDLIPREEQERLLASIPDAELVVYEGGGHCPNWEEPARVAADIVQFADRVSSMESAAPTR